MGCCTEGYDDKFDEALAKKDIERLREDGPDATTLALLKLLRVAGVKGAMLLDVGGGVGAIHHELIDAGAERAVHADASAAYIRVAREEVDRRGHTGRVEFVHGDFVAMADRIPPADVVTLDRVICCYPDMESLVAASASRAKRLYGAVFPRDRWFLRIAFPVMNFFIRMRKHGILIYHHRPGDIDAAIRAQGLALRSSARTFIWQVVVYARAGRVPAPPPAPIPTVIR